MKISVVTVVLNDANGIRMTLRSVRDQDHPHIEHVIIDGGSTDSTLDVINKNEPSGTVLVSEFDHGIYDAMNKGVALATGEVIGFLNAADLFDSASTLSKIIRCFEEPDVDAIYGDVLFFDDGGRVVRRWRAGTYHRWKTYVGWAVPHPAFFIRSSVLRRIGQFDPNFRSAGDYEFMLRCFLRHDIQPMYIEEQLVRMKIGGFSNRSLRNFMINAIEGRRAWKQNSFRFGFLAPWLKPLTKIFQYVVAK